MGVATTYTGPGGTAFDPEPGAGVLRRDRDHGQESRWYFRASRPTNSASPGLGLVDQRPGEKLSGRSCRPRAHTAVPPTGRPHRRPHVQSNAAVEWT